MIVDGEEMMTSIDGNGENNGSNNSPHSSPNSQASPNSQTSPTNSDNNHSNTIPPRIMIQHNNMNNNLTPKSLERVLSSAETNFEGKYEMLGQIGKGGFSQVHRCKHLITGDTYAVKVIDLKPLRMQQKFNPQRLRREVDIMRKLRHPNVIQFVEVFETENTLQIVMEYAPGSELFDLILAKKRYSEDIARPIFAQIAEALFYLHSKQIIHRDVKPENVLILDAPDASGQVVAKLLDFGLSKHLHGTNAGAKTFVGTPCYLAPEVEYTSKGQGGTYGVSADCWSLGALLHVMMVARFPEWAVVDNSPSLHFDQKLWEGISESAMDLIRRLMDFNPQTRMSMSAVLAHPWLEQFKRNTKAIEQLKFDSVDTAPLNVDLHLPSRPSPSTMQSAPPYPPVKNNNYTSPDNISPMSSVASNMTSNLSATFPPSGHGNHHQQIEVYNPKQQLKSAGNAGNKQVTLPLAPLMELQTSIATCFDEVHAAYTKRGHAQLASQVRKGALLCRNQLLNSTKMIRHVEQTATMVLDMFPDFELAIEAGEPQLAAQFFHLVRDWVSDLKKAVKFTQDANRESMEQTQNIVEESAAGIRRVNDVDRNARAAKANETQKSLQAKLSAIREELVSPQTESTSSGSANGTSTSENKEMTEKFFEIFDVMSEAIDALGSSDVKDEEPFLPMEMSFDEGRGGSDSTNDVDANASITDGNNNSRSMAITPSKSRPPALAATTGSPTQGTGSVLSDALAEFSIESRLEGALQQLRQVDLILEQLGVFWANTEVVLELLTKKGQRAEQMVGFAHKPALMARFRQMMTEYGRFWKGIQNMCNNYINGAEIDADDTPGSGINSDGMSGVDGSGDDNLHSSTNESGRKSNHGSSSDSKNGSSTRGSDSHFSAPSMGQASYDFTGVDEGLERFMERKISTPPRMNSTFKQRQREASEGSYSGSAHTGSANGVNTFDDSGQPPVPGNLTLKDQAQNSNHIKAYRRDSPDPLVAQMSSGDDVNDMAAEFRRSEKM